MKNKKNNIRRLSKKSHPYPWELMNKISQRFKTTLIGLFWIFIWTMIVSFAYAYSNSTEFKAATTTSSWDPLTATLWNDIVNQVWDIMDTVATLATDADLDTLSWVVISNKSLQDSLSWVVATNRSDFDNLDTEVDTNRTDFDTLSWAVATNRWDFDTLSWVVATNRWDFDTLSWVVATMTYVDNSIEAIPWNRIRVCDWIISNAIYANWWTWMYIIQSWTWASWSPTNTAVYNDTPKDNSCEFECAPTFTYGGGICS